MLASSLSRFRVAAAAARSRVWLGSGPARFVTCPSHAGNKMEQMLLHQFKTLLMVALSHIKSLIGRSW
jgi:hypothetical protein